MRNSLRKNRTPLPIQAQAPGVDHIQTCRERTTLLNIASNITTNHAPSMVLLIAEVLRTWIDEAEEPTTGRPGTP